jgi:hypothetical protein
MVEFNVTTKPVLWLRHETKFILISSVFLSNGTFRLEKTLSKFISYIFAEF